MLCNFIFYLFGAAFNSSFLLYVGLFVLSAFALIFYLANIDAKEISLSLNQKIPNKIISGFMMFFWALLGVMWIILSLSYIVTGKVPSQIVQTGHPAGVVFATDLSILIPCMIISSVLLWKRHAWGFVLGIIIMVKATLYGLVLIIMTVFTYFRLGIMDPFIFLWVALTGGCIISVAYLFGKFPRADNSI